ncbi:MAG: hypothetical protein LUF89_00475 [Ruminococcus sp.]|nr:hypothetical protein [Ruminococcus sp.]
MKSGTVIVGIVLLGNLVLQTGCSGSNGETSAAQSLSDSFTVEMTMIIDDLEGAGEITRFGEGEWSVDFTEPSSLAGVVLEFSGSDITASYQGFAFSVPQSAMPTKSMLLHLIQVVDTLAQQEKIDGKAVDDYVVVEGDSEGNPYTLTLTQDGELVGFEMDNMDAIFSFSTFQTGVAERTTTPVATETTNSTS